MKPLIKPLIIIFMLVLLDQVSKYALIEVFKFTPYIRIFSFLNLMPVYNTGVSFGLLKSFGSPLLILLTAVLIFFIFRLLFTETVKMYRAAYMMILAGALGNLIDRIRLGAVFDFICFAYKEYAFPAFNIADSMITLGAGLYLLTMLRKRH